MNLKRKLKRVIKIKAKEAIKRFDEQVEKSKQHIEEFKEKLEVKEDET